MQVANILQMNDWEIKKFIRIILAIQLALWGLIGLDAIGIQLPIARQLVGFIYLTFVPGFILLRILKLHGIGNIETILYTVGLSIVTLMFTGAFMNAVFPSLGISGPIATVPLVVTISAVILVLCIICYLRDRDFQDPNFIDLKNILSPSVLFLCLIPFLAIFGTYAANFYHINSMLLLTLALIAVIAALIGLDLFISTKMYPLAVLLFAISLVFHKSLISMYVWGWDINIELYLSRLVSMHSIWDPTIPITCNSMLSIVMLTPIYSIISDLSITWVFKIIYPFLFSLVPLGLYQVFQKQTDDKIAFVSCLFFISLGSFYIEMLILARQQIAELFLVLLILLMINKSINKLKRSFLMIIFSISLAVSHYGLSYIFMLCLILAWLMLVLAENKRIRKLMNNYLPNFGKELSFNPNRLKSEDRSINSAFVLLFITFTLTWYISLSDSSAFDSIARIGKQIIGSLSTDFLNPDASQGLKLVTAQSAPGFLHDINKAMNYFNQIYIIIGGIVLLLKFRAIKFEPEYISFAELNLGICFVGLTVPYFASALNMSRLYQMTLIFLAPICVIGGMEFIRSIIKLAGISWTDRQMAISVKILSIYFAIFLLYQSGIVFGLTEDISDPLLVYNSSIDFPRFNDREVSGATWLNNIRGNQTIFADSYRSLLLSSFARDKLAPSKFDASYVYLGTFNIMYGSMVERTQKKAITTISYVPYNSLIDDRDMIYSNGGASISA
jgi:uncharacterized membrane protein